jgi:hypothetical protein
MMNQVLLSSSKPVDKRLLRPDLILLETPALDSVFSDFCYLIRISATISDSGDNVSLPFTLKARFFSDRFGKRFCWISS